MNRPDTGTQRNTIVNLAAAIMASKIEYWQSVAEQREAHHDVMGTLEARHKAAQITLAVQVMDTYAGCWS